MTKDQRKREAVLRRAAGEKGLFIKKRKWKMYYTQYSYESHDGYCIGSEKTGLIIWGEDQNGMFAPTLEEAEEIVFNY